MSLPISFASPPWRLTHGRLPGRLPPAPHLSAPPMTAPRPPPKTSHPPWLPTRTSPPGAATTPPASSAWYVARCSRDGWIDGCGCVCDMEVSQVAVVAGLDTLLPLHTAVASARLKSCIAVDSTCWCSLSQGKPAQRLTPHLHWLDVSVSD
ncbi:hypothetical protein ZWY2020_008235 [Hordeum vulgare]|nr:hypothetical protein ZWY2020_008235 [Hordeum vulgare]